MTAQHEQREADIVKLVEDKSRVETHKMQLEEVWDYIFIFRIKFLNSVAAL
jgi:hypothetical protein